MERQLEKRLELHEILCGLLGSRQVYFQPPPTVQMKYPCIVYERLPYRTLYANNLPYVMLDEYRLTVIDKNPDTQIPRKVAQMMTARAERPFQNQNLNHYPYTIYY